MNRLKKMLTYMRPHDSYTEQSWVETFIMPYDPEVFGEGDTVHAYAVTVLKQDGTYPRTLFSSHVDTVHSYGGRQKLVMENGMISKNDGKPLGADDAAGVWLLLEMIDAKVPGVYLFHRGEECGGIGSRWMSKAGAEWLSMFDRAIAFDRKSTFSVITYQGGQRCCSDEFGEALADAFNTREQDFMYITDDTGVFTDTKVYTRIIPECTNVSVGYYDEHRPTERLDTDHLMKLRDACVTVDWESLPVKRDPSRVEYKKYTPSNLFKSARDLDVDAEFDDLEAYFNMKYGNLTV